MLFRVLQRWTVAACLLLGTALAPTSATSQTDTGQNVLIIYGTGGLATWEQTFNQVFRDELSAEFGVYVTPEFLSLVNADDSEKDIIARSLALKYEQQELALVVALLPEANTFVREYRHVFAPNADVLHILPADNITTDYDDSITISVLESSANQAIAETMRILPTLMPDLTGLTVIGGGGAGDRSYMARFRQVFESMALPYEFSYMSGLTSDELINALKALPPDNAIVMTTYDRDDQGNLLRTLQITETVATEVDRPVLVMSDNLLSTGALGGNVSTVAGYALTAASLVEDILRGLFPDDPVTARTQFKFNGQALDRFAVNRDSLPVGSQIVFDQPNLWRQYGTFIIAGVIVIAIQLALIALLLQAIRRRRRAEKELRQTQKLEALGNLAGGIAHDFNNILMSIIANAELAEDEATSGELKGRLGNILSASERAKNLVRQILMFSRPAGDSETSPLDVCAHIKETIEQFRAFAPPSCKISIDCETNLPAVRINPTQLHQLILNICVNAQHAVENEGVIAISAVSMKLEQAKTLHNQIIPRGNYVMMNITDSGTGMSHDTMNHIFEPFYTTKPRGKGTGLGLALVYQIVKNHGGYIDLQSEVGLGTTFSLYFKAESQDIQPIEPLHKDAMIQGTSERILLVDDDEMVLDVINRIFESLGYSVNAFTSSIAASQHFENHPNEYDLVFTDLSMPEMDGVRLINKVRQVRPLMPVILCTGYMDSLDANEISNCQILNKPVRSTELSEAIHNSLRRNAKVA